MRHYDAIMRCLRSHPLKNVTLLKMMTAYHEEIDSYFIEQGEHWGILLLLPASSYSFDQRTYPEADTVVLIDYSSPAMISAIMERIPRDAKLVFKVQQEARLAVEEYFPLHPARSFYSYSSAPGQSFSPDEEAVVSGQIDSRLLPLWYSNGYTQEEIVHYFQAGAFSVALYAGENPRSTCIVFRNEEQIWEIGAVHTAEAGRRRGLASRVVRTALFHTLQRGYIPRYQVQDTNIASIRLAEALGLSLAVKLEHWTNYIEQPE
jgi:GNAT superfamily N-acetyltransferase